MGGKISNEYGTITVSEEVIAQISGMTATECYGIVGMAARNVKDDIVQLLKIENLTTGIGVQVVDETKVDIEFHIIVEYGTKISAVTENLMSTVKYKVKDMLGFDVRQIRVFVEGVRVDN